MIRQLFGVISIGRPPAIAAALIGASGLYLVASPFVGGSRRARPKSRADSVMNGVALLSRAEGRLQQVLPARLSENDGLDSRLAAAGETRSAAAFRARQVLVALVGALAGFLVITAIAAPSGLTAGRMSFRSSALGALVAGITAFAALDVRLSAKARRRRAEIASQVPAVSDLLCLGVVAGESLRAALTRATDEASGALGDELGSALREVEAGGQLIPALERMSSRADVGCLRRLVTAISLAHERGTPLSDQLQAIATEIRAEYRNRVLEAAGNSQTRMLIPVVTLILPTALAFAFFPGFVALRAFVG